MTRKKVVQSEQKKTIIKLAFRTEYFDGFFHTKRNINTPKYAKNTPKYLGQNKSLSRVFFNLHTALSVGSNFSN